MQESSMKILGMIGGTGPESTVEYYRRLIATYHARVSESGAPPIIINSVDNKNLVKWFTAGELTRVVDFLAAEIERLARAGADFALIAAVTPHLGFDKLQQQASIPLLSIVEATADAAKKAGLRRLALFGTRFTMQAALFPEAFARRGMTIVVPDEKEQEFVHAKYMGELFVGAILDETRASLVDLVEIMKRRDHVDGLILGGTELSLILREPTAAGLSVLDTTQIHVETALEWMLRE
ncbi:MAG: aspartate racemase [Verrucomicrobia bacterium]|nr:MAG: aspartate racemase [Verrucomicrobiota bacterium]